MRGKVKFFNLEKGYGFITASDNDGKDIFFHYSEIVMEGFKTITDGTEVEFELEETARGPQARKIVKIQ